MVPILERHCGSWVACRDGKAAFETFSSKTAEAAARAGFEILTAAQWLGKFNRAARQQSRIP